MFVAVAFVDEEDILLLLLLRLSVCHYSKFCRSSSGEPRGFRGWLVRERRIYIYIIYKCEKKLQRDTHAVPRFAHSFP